MLSSNDNSSEVPKIVNVQQSLLAGKHAAHRPSQRKCLTLENQWTYGLVHSGDLTGLEVPLTHWQTGYATQLSATRAFT